MRKVLFCSAVSAIAVALLFASCTYRVELIPRPAKEPIKVEVKVDLHIYQHAVADVGYVTGAPEAPAKEKTKEESPAPEKKESRAGGVFLRLLGVGVAYAEAPSDEQQLKSVLDSMRKRYPALKEYKADKSIGENRSGFVEERPSPKVSDDKYAKRLRELITAENADRRLLYQVRARMSRTTPEKVGSSYAKVWQDAAAPGDWIEVPVKKTGEKQGWVWKQK